MLEIQTRYTIVELLGYAMNVEPPVFSNGIETRMWQFRCQKERRCVISNGFRCGVKLMQWTLAMLPFRIHCNCPVKWQYGYGYCEISHPISSNITCYFRFVKKKEKKSVECIIDFFTSWNAQSELWNDRCSTSELRSHIFYIYFSIASPFPNLQVHWTIAKEIADVFEFLFCVLTNVI